MSSERGTKYNSGKPKMSLIPSRAEIEEAYVWTMGESKYGKYNWTKGIPFSEILDALHRHYTAYKSGQTVDPESGRTHMAHIRCCAAMLIEFEQTRPDLDDRIKKKDLKPVDHMEDGR